jgi:hypothetical protein
MAYRNKTYIAFDGDNDIRYYWLMKAWKYNSNDFFDSFNFYDAHSINSARDSSQEQSIKRQLSGRLENSKLFILLVGESTKFLYKFVRWEINQAIEKEIPIIVVNLNGKRDFDKDNCPLMLSDKTAIHISFNQKIIEYALNNWIEQKENIKRQGKSGAFYYTEEIYNRFGL